MGFACFGFYGSPAVGLSYDAKNRNEAVGLGLRTKKTHVNEADIKCLLVVFLLLYSHGDYSDSQSILPGFL